MHKYKKVSLLNLSEDSTRYKAIKMRYLNPYRTLESIANECGVTKQRIYKIFKDARIPKRPQKPPKKLPYCKNCGLISWNEKKICSSLCYNEYYLLEYPCSNCGKLKIHTKRKFRHGLKYFQQYNYFCDHHCYIENRRKKRS